jgi:arsenate reductase
MIDIKKKKVLFLCTHNSARSQMAEGLLRATYEDRYEAYSAGIKATSIDPRAVLVMKEIGIDISGHRSKAVEEIDAASVDAVVTLCAEEVCPVFLGNAVRLHWALSDPAKAPGDDEARLNAFRATRDELLRRMKLLFDRWAPFEKGKV